MTTKILVIAILLAIVLTGCDGMERMMPPDSEVEMPDVIQSSATSEWSHLCEGYKEWADNSNDPPIVATQSLSDIYIESIGVSQTSDDGVDYSFSRNQDGSTGDDYEIGDWITGFYFNTPRDSHVPIDFVYLCVDSNLVDTGDKYVFKADTKGRVEFAFRLLPELKSMDRVDFEILSTIVFKDGTVMYDRIVSIYIDNTPNEWSDVGWEQVR